MRHILLVLALMTSVSIYARTLYLKGNPQMDPTKVIPTSEILRDANNRQSALLLIESEVPGLQIQGEGIIGETQYSDGVYAVHIADGARTFYLLAEGMNPLHVGLLDKAVGGKVYTLSVYDDIDDSPVAFHQEGCRVTIHTMEGAEVSVDGQVMLPSSAAVNSITLPGGRHTLQAMKSLQAAGRYDDGVYNGSYIDYSSERVTIDATPGDAVIVNLPITGAINFHAHPKHKSDNVSINLRAVTDGNILETVAPGVTEMTATTTGQVVPNLRGRYIATYSAPYYKTKKSEYTVTPGSTIDAEIKLDPKKCTYFAEYYFSPRSMIGLDFGGCGKYFGWSGRFYMMGLEDPLFGDDEYYNTSYGYPETKSKKISWGIQTGPVFRILRARTSLFLTVAGGYEKVYYDKNFEDANSSHFVASAKLTLRFPKGFLLGLGYNIPFSNYDGPKYQEWYNAFITIGGSF